MPPERQGSLFQVDEAPAAAAGGDQLPATATVRVRMTVAYDGSAFHGFAPNPGVSTVRRT
jgi:hypothetical protein